MKRQIYALFLVVLLFALVQLGKTSIEVDANGDEYEVKRFHIQGREVNEYRPQCVVTRRKRSNADARQYNVDPEPVSSLIDDTKEKEHGEEEKEEEGDDEEEDVQEEQYEKNETEAEEDENEEIAAGIAVEEEESDEKPVMINTKKEHKHKTRVGGNKDTVKKTTSIALQHAATKPENLTDIKTKAENTLTLVLPNNYSKQKIKKVTLLLPKTESTATKEEKEKEFEREKEREREKEKEREKQKEREMEKTQITIVQPTIQLIPHQISQIQPEKENLYAVIQAQNPPKQSSLIGVLPTNEHYAISDGVDNSWIYSENPATTTALWSTGEDVQNVGHKQFGDDESLEYVDTTYPEGPQDLISTPNLDYDYNNGPVAGGLDVVEEVEIAPSPVPAPAPAATPNKKPTKKPNSRPNSRPNSKPIYKPTKLPTKKVIKRKRPHRRFKKTRRPNKNSKRPNRPFKKIVRPAVVNRKRPNIIRRRFLPIQSARGQTENSTDKKSKKKIKPIGTFTSTRSITTTDMEDEGNIDCIIINKDIANSSTSSSTSTTTTTTRRPFWNILGRRVNNPRNFGNRKRVALRFASE